MDISIRTSRITAASLILMLVLASQPRPAQAAGICALSPGQVLINEIFPSPSSSNPEWIELFNNTSGELNLSYCYLDDIAGGGKAPVQIPEGNIIPPNGFWTLDFNDYFNNTGDDVRLLTEDASTVLDSHTYSGSVAQNHALYRITDGGTWATAATTFATKGATNSGTCGSGTWTAGNLEIHHINIGQGDATLIVGPGGKSLLFDLGESSPLSSEKATLAGSYIQTVLGCRRLDYVVISHFHLDHIGAVGHGGLWHLVEAQGFSVEKSLFRDYDTYLGSTSSTFEDWKTYIEGDGLAKLHPLTALEGTSQVNLGSGVSFNILAVDGNGALKAGNFSADSTPPSENDYSVGALLSYGDFDEWIGGDLDGEFSSASGYAYHDIELSAAREIGDVDVYKVNHHASSHSSNFTFVTQLDPEISIVTVGDSNPYGHPTQAIMNRLLATSTVYLTERGDPDTEIGAAIVAGDIVIKTANGSGYTVNGTGYTATEPARTDADGDGYFAEVDPADNDPYKTPAPKGGCDADYQVCYTEQFFSARSQGANDGWVLESAESSNAGGTLNAANTTLRLGDNPAKKQYRSILSFSTGSLPNNAVLLKVELHVRKQGITGGGNPLTLFQGFRVDVKNGFFGSAASLAASDFQAKAGKSFGPFSPTPVNGWYILDLTAAKGYVNKLATNGGLTQLRLRFTLDDNNNGLANYLSLYSGNASTGNRPQLVIKYYVP